MNKIFPFVGTLILLGFFISASSDVMKSYHRFLKDPIVQNYDTFNLRATNYRKRSPLKFYRLLEQYHGNWTFKILFLRTVITSAHITPMGVSQSLKSYYNLFLKWLFEKMVQILLSCNFDELEFKKKLEILSLLLKIAKRSYKEINSIGQIDQRMHANLENRINVWDYLIKNVSLNFENKSVNYYSLSLAFNEIRSIIMSGKSNDNSKLSKLSTLLWFYLYKIYINDCMLVFEEIHGRKSIYLYLIQRLWEPNYQYQYFEDYHAERIQNLLQELYKGGTLQLIPIRRFLNSNNPRCYNQGLKKAKNVSTFNELSRFLEYEIFKKTKCQTWKVKAFVEIESILLLHSS
jgi:hypothetical protein